MELCNKNSDVLTIFPTARETETIDSILYTSPFLYSVSPKFRIILSRAY